MDANNNDVGHHAVGHDDLVVLVVPQNGIPQHQGFYFSGHDAAGSGQLNPVAHPERAVKQQGETGDEVAQGALGRQADNDGSDTDAGQHGGA